MKRYKLLKDLPTFKAGEIFYVKDKGNLARVSDDVSMYSKKTMDNFPNILTDWFEEIPETYKRWRAEIGQYYWFLNDYGICQSTIEAGANIDKHYYDLGDYFKSKKEARSHKKYLLARQVLLDDAEGGKFILDSKNWTGYYVYGINRWLTQIVPQYYPGLIYFRSREALEKSLEEHKEQWEIVRKYEMGA